MAKQITYQQYCHAENVVEYYDKTSADYEGWSKGYNMHFGFFRYKNLWQAVRDIWRLEPQLQQANVEVFNKLAVKKTGRYLDMGCGLGATARSFAKSYPSVKLTGITISDVQVETAKNLLKEEVKTQHCVDFARMDYQNTHFDNNAFDGVYALESACHARGRDKKAFIAEAYRILKPNGTLVMHDAFVLKPTESANSVFRYCYGWLCKGWATEHYIDKKLFAKSLKNQGFKDITFTNAFWHTLPSALHMPRVITVYLLKKMLFSSEFYTDKALRKQRINHCLGSMGAIIVSLHIKHFSYYVVTARK